MKKIYINTIDRLKDMNNLSINHIQNLVEWHGESGIHYYERIAGKNAAMYYKKYIAHKEKGEYVKALRNSILSRHHKSLYILDVKDFFEESMAIIATAETTEEYQHALHLLDQIIQKTEDHPEFENEYNKSVFLKSKILKTKLPGFREKTYTQKQISNYNWAVLFGGFFFVDSPLSLDASRRYFDDRRQQYYVFKQTLAMKKMTAFSQLIMINRKVTDTFHIGIGYGSSKYNSTVFDPDDNPLGDLQYTLNFFMIQSTIFSTKFMGLKPFLGFGFEIMQTKLNGDIQEITFEESFPSTLDSRLITSIGLEYNPERIRLLGMRAYVSYEYSFKELYVQSNNFFTFAIKTGLFF